MKKVFAILVCALMIALLAFPCMAAAPEQEDGAVYTTGAAAGEAAADEEMVDKEALTVMIIIGVVVVGFGLGGVLWLGRKKPMPPTHGFETKHVLEDEEKEGPQES